MAVEIGERVSDPGASAEIVDALAHRVERAVQVAIPKQPRDPREACRKHKRLEVFAASDRVGEDHQEPRVALHRTAHVADEHQRPSAYSWTAMKQTHHLAARPNRVASGAAQVKAPGMRRPQASGLALGHAPRRGLEQLAYLLGLLPGHLLEVLVPQQLLRAIAARACGHR